MQEIAKICHTAMAPWGGYFAERNFKNNLKIWWYNFMKFNWEDKSIQMKIWSGHTHLFVKTLLSFMFPNFSVVVDVQNQRY